MGCTNDYDNPIVYFFSVIAHLTFTSGCNSVWQECNIWDVDAASSNLVIPRGMKLQPARGIPCY